jgi:hypothetical protein
MKKISIVRFALASTIVVGSILATQAFAKPLATNVTYTGLITCSRCLDLSQHKGSTPWSWAMSMVSRGDDIVIVASGKVYKLQGDRQQLSKYIQDKATVSGSLDTDTITVANITRPVKVK